MDAQSFDQLRRLAWTKLAAAAYLAPDVAAGRAGELGYPLFRPFDERGVQGFSAGNGQETVLCFGGLQGSLLEDCGVNADDLTLVEATATDGRVRRGLLLAYAWARHAAWRAVAACGSDLPVICAGQSLGGALAVLAAAEAHLHTRAAVSLVTFEAPPVGDALFCRTLGGLLAGEMLPKGVLSALSVPPGAV